MELFSKKRRGIYVYFKHVRDISKLEKYGNVISVSKKHRYIYLYNDDEKIDKIINDLSEKKFVKKVVKSELIDLTLDFVKNYDNDIRHERYEV
ncbi:DUF2129 domain-containing protein [Gemelliphila palaticanis]|uniref:DUF2129 domain-containing protein n=1 Tax=Gemelliphila palaticanis TaxID=81950 RepID=A0ABX2SZ81_9BACL|nr:DUF2129 domain-containing protein [Gemella palaticanis]MBF0715650.1 DUF2129 domain-containing protein [Gemella palaticanis]NYS47580.1 DUF2129 domain-containing protein [Gemella palaticanis]